MPFAVILVLVIVVVCFHSFFFDKMVVRSNHGEVSRKGDVQFVIPRMPYVCAIYMQFAPTNKIDRVKTINIVISVFDNTNNLVLSDIVEGNRIYEKTQGGLQYSGGSALVYRFVENKSNIKLHNKYRVLLTVSGRETNDFEKITVSSECYY